ncbi:hypothetical protein FHG87_011333 [Trinorchestia longiramus]|nr:hypothetical protein FHG87_011333 [Trinorchestia longiramus]
MTECLRPSWHIRKLRTACFKALNLLKFLAHSSYGSDKRLLLRLYLALIKPKIDCGNEAYGSACPSLLETVQPIKNAALRIATGAFRSSSITSLHTETRMKTLDQHRSLKMLNYYIRLLINPDTHKLQEVRNIPPHLFLSESIIPRPFLLHAMALAEKYHIHFGNAMVEMTTIFFPLRTTGIKACTVMFHVWKFKMGTTAARALFLDHLTSYSQFTFIIREPI